MCTHEVTLRELRPEKVPRARHASAGVTGRWVVLRPLRDEDRLAMGSWMQDAETARWMGSAVGPWDSLPPQGEWLSMGIHTASGRLVGYVALRDLSRRLREAELYMCIGDKDLWGRGLGADALGTYLAYISSVTRLSRIYLRVYADNRRAIGCYRKCGFRVRGILRAGSRRERGFRDLLLMELDMRTAPPRVLACGPRKTI